MSSIPDFVSQCEAEQLHLSGAIQSCGVLLHVDAAGSLSHVSANATEVLGLDVRTLLAQPVSRFDWLQQAIDQLGMDEGASMICPGTADNEGSLMDLRLVRCADGGAHAEIQRAVMGEPLPDFHALQRALFRIPEDEAALEAYCVSLVDSIVRLTGYHRAMIYRFRDDWSGEVVAEKTSPELGSYLGLRFPASDIPAIARQLYLLNPWRHIPDTRAASVPLVAAQDAPLDLTYTDLRSVSPVHLIYLANMGVGASFSLPIRVANRLWGLVACHHLEPRALSLSCRQACANLTSSFSLGLSSHLASRRIQKIDSLERRVDRILEYVSLHPDPLDGIEANGSILMEAMGAEGLATIIGTDVILLGSTPSLDEMEMIDAWFVGQWSENLFASDHLGELFSDNPLLLSVAAGMLAVKTSSPRSGWVRFYWFRPEEAYEVAWAGNPDKPTVENAGAVMLSPRRSFEKWVEMRTGYSRPWTNEDRMTAAKFRTALLRWL